MNNKLIVRVGASISAAALPLIAFAQGLGATDSFQGTASGDLIPAVFKIINYLLIIAGVVAAIYLIMGGIRYITSQGEEGETEKAKNTILYALIGLIVIALSAAIVNFIISSIQTAI